MGASGSRARARGEGDGAGSAARGAQAAHRSALSPGDPAPDFDLPRVGGGRIALSDLRGAPAVLWFFPGAHGPACTRQALELRDLHEELSAAGYRVLGIANESVEELERWARQHDLPQILASDMEHEASAAYGAWGEKKLFGRPVVGSIRTTAAIDAHGVLTLIRHRVHVPTHARFLREHLDL